MFASVHMSLRELAHGLEGEGICPLKRWCKEALIRGVSAEKSMCIFSFYTVLVMGGQLDTLLFESDQIDQWLWTIIHLPRSNL